MDRAADVRLHLRLALDVLAREDLPAAHLRQGAAPRQLARRGDPLGDGFLGCNSIDIFTCGEPKQV